MRPIILILGPTAGGKTSLSIELANRIEDGGECIIADSMQVYTGMDIGTAKPTAEEPVSSCTPPYRYCRPKGRRVHCGNMADQSE